MIITKSTNIYETLTTDTNADQLSEANLARSFTLNSYEIDVATSPMSEPIVAGIIQPIAGSSDLSVIAGLKAFFKTNSACLLMTKSRRYLIWKDDLAYYLFDPQGRDFTGSVSLKMGQPSLFCFEKPQNLAHHIAKQSKLKSTAAFTLLSIWVKRLDPAKNSTEKLAELTQKITKWRIINSSRAILHGSIHIGNTCFAKAAVTDAEKSLAASCAAVAYTKVSSPNTWNSQVLDKILVLGHQLLGDSKHLNVNDLLKKICSLGQYTIELSIKPNVYCGQLLHAVHFKQTDLRRDVHAFFAEFRSAILQADVFTFAAWKTKDDAFFLFDPYGRPANGLIPDTSKVPSSTTDYRCCLHMHNTLDSLCSVLHDNVMKISPKKAYTLHEIIAINRSVSASDVSLNESVDSRLMEKLVCRPEVGMIYSDVSEASTDSDATESEVELEIEELDEESEEEEAVNIFDLSSSESEGMFV